MATDVSDARVIGRVVAVVIRRPRLLLTAFRTAWRFRRSGWYRRVPFLPLPPREYVAWRLHTAYGEHGTGPTPDEVERYLLWTDRMQRSRRRS
ncbi:MAG: hypothetical protein ACRELV_10830 [Longimicrobiales bacterium]